MPENTSENEILLDGRYRIIRKIGEGGFGITYEAVNIHNSTRVAVKECKSEADKARFLREARVLRDFADEPAVVTVLDSFEEEDTAYIVMEYLEGVTIAREIKTNGKWAAETTVRRLVPVMKALEKMHVAGVIHRDISPDNLMYMPDGSVILMDFGAALPAEKNDFTRTAIFKSVYSPPEQRDDAFLIGSWSDVYALCATIWFIITGVEPEDSLSRLLYDELQKPSEAGADILPAAEEALMKGLALLKDGRTQDILTLRTELEEVYPDLSEEEKKEIERRRRKRRRIIAGCICAAAAVTIILLYAFRINIWFSFIETETIVFDGQAMDHADYTASVPVLKERALKMADENRYLWQEKDQQIFFELPVEDLKQYTEKENVPGKDLYALLNRSVSKSKVLSVISLGDDGSPVNHGIFSQTEDIESITKEDDAFIVTLSDQAAEKLDGLLDQKEETIWFGFDYNEETEENTVYLGKTLGDGKSVRTNVTEYFDMRSRNDYYINWGSVDPPASLVEMQFTKAPASGSFRSNLEWMVQWEDMNSTLLPGRNQKNTEEIPGKTVCVRISDTLHEEKTVDTEYDPSALSLLAMIKNRLDRLGVPYAFGKEILSNNSYVVKVPNNAVWFEELDTLTNDFNLHLGSRLINSSAFIKSDPFIENHEDGTFSLAVPFDETDTEKTAETIRTAAGQGDGNLYLYMSSDRIALCDPDDALASLQSEGIIRFDQWAFSNHTEMDDSTLHFANLLSTGDSDTPVNSYHLDEDTAEVKDENGNIIWFDYEELLPEKAFVWDDDAEITALYKKWNAEYSGRFTFSDSIRDIRNMRINLHTDNVLDPSSMYSEVIDFTQKYKKELLSGYFHEITFNVSDNDESKYGKASIYIYLKMSFEEQSFVVDYVSSGLLSDYDKNSELEKTYEEYLQNNPLF